MNVVNGHAHAHYGYGAVTAKYFFNLLKDVIETKRRGYLSLNAHLPFEVQHPKYYARLKIGLKYIRFGEILKKLFQVKLCWENAPAQKETNRLWSLKHSQTDWDKIPKNIDLTLDTGHLMLGVKTIHEARVRIEKILNQRGQQIKHLHLHENDLVHDTHESVGKVIDKKLLVKLTKNRTYIFEKGVAQEDW